MGQSCGGHRSCKERKGRKGNLWHGVTRLILVQDVFEHICRPIDDLVADDIPGGIDRVAHFVRDGVRLWAEAVAGDGVRWRAGQQDADAPGGAQFANDGVKARNQVRRAKDGFEEIDVDGEPELKEKFGDEVPVLFIDGRKAFKVRVTEGELKKRLRKEE